MVNTFLLYKCTIYSETSIYTHNEWDEVIISKSSKFNKFVTHNQEKWQKDKKILEKHNITINHDHNQNISTNINSIFAIIVKKVITKFSLNLSINKLLDFSNIYDINFPSGSLAYLILELAKLTTNNIQPKKHYIVAITEKGNNETSIEKLNTILLPEFKKYHPITYFLYSNLMGDFLKVNNQKSFEFLFKHHKDICTLGTLGNNNIVCLIKQSCYHNKDSVEKIDSIIYALEQITNIMLDFIDTLEINNITKDYIKHITQYIWFSSSALFFTKHILNIVTKQKLNNLTTITFRK